VAKKARDTPIIDLREIYSNERSGENGMVMVHSQQRIELVQRNPYTMDVNRRENQNCYNCREFEHLVRNCRNREMGGKIKQGRRLEYGENESNGQRRIEEENGQQNNLNGDGNLIVLD